MAAARMAVISSSCRNAGVPARMRPGRPRSGDPVGTRASSPACGPEGRDPATPSECGRPRPHAAQMAAIRAVRMTAMRGWQRYAGM